MAEMKYRKIDNQLITIKISDMLKSIYIYRKKVLVSVIFFTVLILLFMLFKNNNSIDLKLE